MTSMSSPAATLAGRLLRSRAVAALTTPHSIDHYLTQVHPLWVAHEVRARIVDRHVEVDPDAAPGAAPVVTLTLQPTATWGGHRPGQHVSVGVELPGARRTTRVFTLSSHSSRPGERITLTIRARDEADHPGRSVSQFLTSPAALGAIVHLSQAEGDFVLPDRVPEHVVLISGGSGITPVMAMLRSLQLRTHRGRIDFLHFAHTPEQQIFADELELAAHSGNGLNLHRFYPGQGDPYLSPALLERLVPGYADVPTWVCGPSGLIEATRAAYSDQAIAAGTLRVEYFVPPRATGAGGGTLTFERSGTAVANDGAALLDQAEAAGLRPPSGCRMGICFSCVATKRSGTVRNVLTGEVSSLPDDEIRICVSAADGDCTLDL
ncbi:iron-sulfur cluster-binding domain-containing protein [Nocardioides sp.]|uniref:flavin reductase family protein n=1 Tax=Nocardioides sp. TaxID=35761 RepID=UPI0026089E16|nr:iron-sulfur cluster-binding domain-containing protein [Nocardioides sp.]